MVFVLYSIDMMYHINSFSDLHLLCIPNKPRSVIVYVLDFLVFCLEDFCVCIRKRCRSVLSLCRFFVWFGIRVNKGFIEHDGDYARPYFLEELVKNWCEFFYNWL